MQKVIRQLQLLETKRGATANSTDLRSWTSWILCLQLNSKKLSTKISSPQITTRMISTISRHMPRVKLATVVVKTTKTTRATATKDRVMISTDQAVAKVTTMIPTCSTTPRLAIMISTTIITRRKDRTLTTLAVRAQIKIKATITSPR